MEVDYIPATTLDRCAAEQRVVAARGRHVAFLQRAGAARCAWAHALRVGWPPLLFDNRSCRQPVDVSSWSCVVLPLTHLPSLLGWLARQGKQRGGVLVWREFPTQDQEFDSLRRYRRSVPYRGWIVGDSRSDSRLNCSDGVELGPLTGALGTLVLAGGVLGRSRPPVLATCFLPFYPLVLLLVRIVCMCVCVFAVRSVVHGALCRLLWGALLERVGVRHSRRWSKRLDLELASFDCAHPVLARRNSARGCRSIVARYGPLLLAHDWLMSESSPRIAHRSSPSASRPARGIRSRGSATSSGTPCSRAR